MTRKVSKLANKVFIALKSGQLVAVQTLSNSGVLVRVSIEENKLEYADIRRIGNDWVCTVRKSVNGIAVPYQWDTELTFRECRENAVRRLAGMVGME